MLTISVKDTIDKLASKLNDFQRNQLPFAIAKALTDTAKDVQAETRAQIPSRFTLRRQWIVQGIRIIPANKRELVATVYSKDEFMGRQETGDDKFPKYGRHIAIPTSLVRRSKSDIIRKSELPGAMGSKLEVITYRGHKWLALKDRKRGAKGARNLRLMYLLVDRADIKPRLHLGDDAQRIVPRRFAANLDAAIKRALETAR